LAKKPIILPEGVTVSVKEDEVVVRGPQGELSVNIPGGLSVKINGSNVLVGDSGYSSDARVGNALLGTLWALVRNSVAGVSKKFSKTLEIEGVGYKVALEGKDLILNLGYAVPVRYKVIDGVFLEVEKNVIRISGLDKELVGRVASEIRSLKKPEPYKGKGIHYRGEVIRRKAGKKAAATAK
ncbi:MAG: 50S ribosomal protein L6, partial [bacterium]|nr:50S ribosomal protein L6 [bacterium]